MMRSNTQIVFLALSLILLLPLTRADERMAGMAGDGRNGIEEMVEAGTSTTTKTPAAATIEVEEENNSPICDVHENESLHALMDRICELCHDMYSHQKPNMRADCRSDCFRSSNFKRCLRLFKPVGGKGGQRRKLRFMFEAFSRMLLD